MNVYLKGFANGTNREHPEYWGDFETVDQRMVEMAAISLSLILAKDRFWEPLDDNAKKILSHG